MKTRNDDLDNKVIEFVSSETGISVSKLKPELGLFHDLGVDGEDALELIEAFSTKFNVDVSNFPLSDYFGDEGTMSPFGLMKGLVTGRTEDSKKKLTISDLTESARQGIMKNSM